MKALVVPYEFGDVRLRLLTSADLPMTLAWRNRDQIRIWMKNKQPLQLESHRNWFVSYEQCENEYMFIIEERQSSVAIAQVGIYQIDHDQGEAEIGRFIAAPEGIGRGLAKQGMKAMCDWALGPLRLNRVYCDIYADNLASIRACEWAGFHIIGSKGEFLMLERRADDANSNQKAAG